MFCVAVLSGEEKAKSSVERQQQAKYTARVYSLETCNLGVFIREQITRPGTQTCSMPHGPDAPIPGSHTKEMESAYKRDGNTPGFVTVLAYMSTIR